MNASSLRTMLIEWLDDQFHFGDAEQLIGGNDEKSFLEHGILDSLGFVKLVLFLEDRFRMEIDRSALSPANFDSLGKIVRWLEAQPTVVAA